jgi:predicted nucleic acid-binding protein
MRILLDTNVVLDALLGRAPWSGDAESIWRAHAEDRIEACISASALTDVSTSAGESSGGLRLGAPFEPASISS